MNIKNVVNDVDELICRACQDFLKLVIADNWKEVLYELVKNNCENNYYVNSYKEPYRIMREKGMGNYSIDDMDISFIYVIINHCGRSLANVKPSTKNAIKILIEDRNFRYHSSKNENEEEKCCLALLSLVKLKSFIDIVDYNETQISDDMRLKYRQDYACLIKKLKNAVFEEYCECIQFEKDMEYVLNSVEPLEAWCRIEQEYEYRYYRKKNDKEAFFKFFIKASDYGVEYAHENASIALLYFGRYDKAIEKILLVLNLDNPPYRSSVYLLNRLYELEKVDRDKVNVIVDQIKSKGVNLVLDNNGYVIQ